MKFVLSYQTRDGLYSYSEVVILSVKTTAFVRAELEVSGLFKLRGQIHGTDCHAISLCPRYTQECADVVSSRQGWVSGWRSIAETIWGC